MTGIKSEGVATHDTTGEHCPDNAFCLCRNADAHAPSIGVIIPTWRRATDLKRCLRALALQSTSPTAVYVAAKENDFETPEVVAEIKIEITQFDLRVILSPAEANAVEQKAAALAITNEDLIAITDDDSEPRFDWLQRMVPYFDESNVGGVGGRDWQPRERWSEATVGRLQWHGRVIGNHHLGSGAARDVEILKGVNCCFRGDLLRQVGFPKAMRGRGTVIHWEMALCFQILRRGYRLVYDPEIAVDHHISIRVDGDTNQRGDFEPESYFDNIHNETYSLLEHLPPFRRCVYRVWAQLVGTKANPGILQLARLAARRKEPFHQLVKRWRVASEGRRAGYRTWRTTFTPVRLPGNTVSQAEE